MEKADSEELRRQVIEGCLDMTDVNLELEQEFHPLEEEVDLRALAEDETAVHSE